MPSPQVRFLSLSLLLVATLVLQAACKDEQATLLYITVNDKPGMPEDPKTLTVTFNNAGQDFLKLFSAPSGTIGMPTTFVVRADERGGAAKVLVKAKDANDRLLGTGEGSTDLVPDGQVDLAVDLFPADVPINARYISSQTFSFGGPTGRQLASDSKGNFVVVWVDETCPLQRCDVWYRLFDPDAKARLNGSTNDTREQQANSGNAEYDMPAVAVREDGSIVVAWQRYNNKTSMTREIRSRSFLANGAPNTAAGGGELQLSTSTAVDPGSPDVASLMDKHFVVVWHQRDSTKTKWQVMGRYLGPNGQPTKIFNGKNEPFLIAEFTGTSYNRPEPAVAPRSDVNNPGFMVVWLQEGKLWGRAYRKEASPIKAGFSISASGKVDSANISDMTAGYGVIWSDGASCGPDTDGDCVRFRRYNFNGDAQEEGWTINTDYPGDQQDPALARLPSGSLLAVWATSQQQSDSKGGIRGRKLLASGLPVGAEFSVNTTTAKEQTQPTVAHHGVSSFLVVFRDKSETGPDTDAAAIRGRVVYTVFGTTDGEIGSKCDTTTCKSGLSCQTTPQNKRCVATCNKPGDACPHGGKCVTLSVGGTFCLPN
jgi:hypothetical protein